MSRSKALRTAAFVLFFVLVTAFVTGHAYAAGLVPCGDGGIETACTLCHFITGISNIIIQIRNLMVFIGLAVITGMGIVYIVSAGNENLIKLAKNGIKSTLIGIVVVLFAWFIVNMIMFFIFKAKANLGVGVTLQGANGYVFTCSTASRAGTTAAGTSAVSTGSSTSAGTTTGGASQPCEDIATAKARINAGGTVCNNTGSAKVCDSNTLNTYSAYVNAASAKYGIPVSFIQAIMAQETGCNPNLVGPTGDCGIMQVQPTSSTPTCDQLKNPAVGIDWGTSKLKAAYTSAQSLVLSYGGTVTVKELAAAIYNAGPGQSAPSVDCTPATGWKTMPKWGCPINPGSKQYNACAIRSYACNVGSYQ